jgi:hypothetical protein
MAELAATWPGWRNTLSIARSQYKRLLGDGAGALAELAPALAATAPGADMDWPWVATAHVAALHAAGCSAEAVELGYRYRTICLELRLQPSQRNVALIMIDALVALGRSDEACALADECLNEAEASGLRGLALGTFYEARARLALALQDETAFRTFALRCAQEYRCGNDAGLSAKYERLLQAARGQGFTLGALERAVEVGHASGSDATFRTVHSQLSACTGADERARRALELLVQRAGAARGRLYAMRAGRLECIAAQPQQTEPDEQPAGLARFLRRELARSRVAVETVVETASPSTADRTPKTHTGERVEPLNLLALRAARDGEPIIAGVAVLDPPPAQRTLALDEVLQAVALWLLDREDVDPLTCVV